MEIEKLETGSGASPIDGVTEFPDLFSYLDYRLFLRDFYEHKRRSTGKSLRPYSYQHFSAAADIKSPNYLKMIIEGKRNLSDEMIQKFAKALGLTKDLAEQFRILVLMNQCEDIGDRNVLLRNLCELRVEQKMKTGHIDRKTFERIPNWTAWVILAMVSQTGIEIKPSDLRQILRNKASDEDIEKAISGLMASGEVQKNSETGTLIRGRPNIDSSEDFPVALVRKLQTQLMSLGLESLYQDPPTEREFGTLTLSLTQEEFEELKFKLRQMRKSIHKDNSIARMKSPGERVYQLNIQLFPVSEKQIFTQNNREQKPENSSNFVPVEVLLQAASEAAKVFSEPRS